jgi:hypothetical protein
MQMHEPDTASVNFATVDMSRMQWSLAAVHVRTDEEEGKMNVDN